MFKKLPTVLAIALLLSAQTAIASESPAGEELRIYNWSDYIGENTLRDFTQKTGIKVVYDTYSSNEEMEAKVSAGRSGYDIVVPTATPYFARMAQTGIFRRLDKAKIPNLSNLDGGLMQAVQSSDAGNRYGVVYAWGTNGIGLNVDKIKERMPNAPVRSWRMIFDPDVVKKFASCGVTMLDSGYEVFPLALKYLGLDPQSQNPEDLQAAEGLLRKIRPYIRKFDNRDYIKDLSDGTICLALGWSGDVLQAKSRADGAKKGVNIDYNIPSEGSLMWFDMMSVMRDAPHPDAAHKFIDFVLDPANMAHITNNVAYANAVPKSLEMIKDEIKNDEDVFPSPAVRERLFTINQPSPSYEQMRQRAWERVTGKN